jgi:hypothetical protein
MNIRHKLITLGLAFSLLGSTSAFARSTPNFENGFLSHEKVTATDHIPTTGTSGASGDAHRPSPDADKDGWPADMILG